MKLNREFAFFALVASLLIIILGNFLPHFDIQFRLVYVIVILLSFVRIPSGDDIYCLWGGKNEEGSVYSLVGIWMDAKKSAVSLVIFANGKAGEDLACWFGIAIGKAKRVIGVFGIAIGVAENLFCLVGIPIGIAKDELECGIGIPIGAGNKLSCGIGIVPYCGARNLEHHVGLCIFNRSKDRKGRGWTVIELPPRVDHD